MFVQQLEAAISGAPGGSLEALSRTIWKALAASQITDDDAARLAMALEARREAFKATSGLKPSPTSKPRPRAISGPQKAAAIERRRRHAAAGAMPPDIAANFSTGEQAALAVMVQEIRRRGRCDFVMDKIAALAGVCRTTARNALRRAQQLGLIRVMERRIRWWRNLSNIVTLVSADWRRWLRLPRKAGGWVQKPDTHDYQSDSKPSSDHAVFSLFTACSSRKGQNSVCIDTGGT